MFVKKEKQNIKMKESNVTCRVCWKKKKKVISKLVTSELTSIENIKTIKEILLLCVPWMTIKNDYYICEPCLWEVRYTYGFIQKCLKAENALNEANDKREIDLKDLYRIAKQTKIIFINTVDTRVRVEPVDDTVICSINNDDTSNIDLPVKPVTDPFCGVYLRSDTLKDQTKNVFKNPICTQVKDEPVDATDIDNEINDDKRNIDLTIEPVTDTFFGVSVRSDRLRNQTKNIFKNPICTRVKDEPVDATGVDNENNNDTSNIDIQIEPLTDKRRSQPNIGIYSFLEASKESDTLKDQTINIFTNAICTQAEVEPVAAIAIDNKINDDTRHIDLPIEPLTDKRRSQPNIGIYPFLEASEESETLKDQTINIVTNAICTQVKVEPVGATDKANEIYDDTSNIELPIEPVTNKIRSQLNDGINPFFGPSEESTNNIKSKKPRKKLRREPMNPNIFERKNELIESIPDPSDTLPESPLFKELEDALDIVAVDMLFVTAHTDISADQQSDLVDDGINVFNSSKDPSKKKRVIFFGRDLCRGRYACNKCDTMFYSSCDYVDHLRLHRRGKITVGDARVFTCETCQATFAHDVDLRTHTIMHHKIRNPHKCKRCHKQFRYHKLLKSHLKMFENQDKCGFTCSKCEKCFATMETLVQHKENAKDAPCCNYKQCKTCLEKFTIEDFKTHRSKVHLNYLCKECDKPFPTSEALRSHKKSIHTAPNYSMCHECGKRFAAKAYLNRHIQAVHGDKIITCNQCFRTFTTQENLKKHIRNKHSDTSRKTLICDKCGSACSDQKALRFHERMFHANEKKHTCPLCNEGFFRKDYYQRHLRYHDMYATNTCRICKRSFKTQGWLDRHMNIGHDEKGNSLQPCRSSFTKETKTKKKYKLRCTPSFCKICNKVLFNKQTLNYHYMTHLNVRKFICEKCGISFQCPSNLARHRRKKHENPDAEFSCNICHAHQSSSKDLKNHMLKVHKDKKYKCKHCSEVFGRSYLLYDHETTVHKDEDDKKVLLLEMLRQDRIKPSDEELLAYKPTRGGRVARLGNVTVVNQGSEEN